MPSDPATGLVQGCSPSLKAELLSISSCKMRFSIKERKVRAYFQWYPTRYLNFFKGWHPLRVLLVSQMPKFLHQITWNILEPTYPQLRICWIFSNVVKLRFNDLLCPYYNAFKLLSKGRMLLWFQLIIRGKWISLCFQKKVFAFQLVGLKAQIEQVFLNFIVRDMQSVGQDIQSFVFSEISFGFSLIVWYLEVR